MENSKIEWTDHTFNPWIGCTKVSPGCANCYAEQLMDKRYGKVQWGRGYPRQRTTAAYWRQPRKWNRDAQREGVRRRVFCASLADIFDAEVPSKWRRDLFELINQCPNLDFLLLTKRPQNITPMMDEVMNFNPEKTFKQHMPNVWLGTSVEDQIRGDERIPELLKVRAAVLFLSCEPLLGGIEVRSPRESENDDWIYYDDQLRGERATKIGSWKDPSMNRINWIIAGGESGQQARRMSGEWVRYIRDQCVRSNVAFHFKQWGEFNEFGDKVGKKNSGRLLDGIEWSQLPK